MSESTLHFSQEEIDKGKLMSILAYIGILVFIPLLASRDNRYVMYHTQQGLVLFLSFIILNFASTLLSSVFDNLFACGTSMLYLLVWVFLIVLMVMGIINAAQGRAKELPVVGQFGKNFNLVK